MTYATLDPDIEAAIQQAHQRIVTDAATEERLDQEIEAAADRLLGVFQQIEPLREQSVERIDALFDSAGMALFAHGLVSHDSEARNELAMAALVAPNVLDRMIRLALAVGYAIGTVESDF